MVKKKWAILRNLNGALDNVKPSQKIAYSVGRALHRSMSLTGASAALQKSTYFVVDRAGLHRLRTVSQRKNCMELTTCLPRRD